MTRSRMVYIIFSIIFLVLGGIAYTYQKGELGRYSPGLERFVARSITKIKQIGNGPSVSNSPLQSFKDEAKALLSPSKIPRKLMPKPSGDSGGTENVFKEWAGGNPASDVIYSWRDKNGVRHFTNANPPSDASDIKIIKKTKTAE